MSFVLGYKNDIFISYATVDDLTANGEEKGWVSQFHKHLEIQLSKRVGRIGVIQIWRGPLIDGNQLFDDTIKTAINESAVFLALHSQGYLASEYCQKELTCFIRKCENDNVGIKIGDRSRLFNILINNILHQNWIEEFKGTSGYPFHDANRDEEFGEPLDPKDKVFQRELRELVDSIYLTLNMFKESVQLSTPQSGKDISKFKKEEFSIYLADVADTLRSTYTRIKNELQQQKFKVVHSIPPPYEAKKHETRIVEELKNTNLSIHLLDQFPGREIEGKAGKTYPQKQIELGITYSPSQIIWVPKNLEVQNIEDDNYKNFIDQLENGQISHSNYDFIRGTPITIVHEIFEHINLLQSKIEKLDGDDLKAVLLDTHLKDQTHAFELSQYFLKKSIQPYINPEEDNPESNLKILEERLKQVSQLYIIWGRVHESWVIQRQTLALNLIKAHSYPLKAFVIYSVPPPKPIDVSKFSIGSIPVYVIDHSSGFNPETLAPILL